jgi:hypothetical protein
MANRWRLLKYATTPGPSLLRRGVHTTRVARDTPLLSKLLYAHKLKLLDWRLQPGRGDWRLQPGCGDWRLQPERRCNRLKRNLTIKT